MHSRDPPPAPPRRYTMPFFIGALAGTIAGATATYLAIIFIFWNGTMYCPADPDFLWDAFIVLWRWLTAFPFLPLS